MVLALVLRWVGARSFLIAVSYPWLLAKGRAKIYAEDDMKKSSHAEEKKSSHRPPADSSATSCRYIILASFFYTNRT